MPLRRHGRLAMVGVGAVTALAATTLAPAGVDAATVRAQPRFDKHTVMVSGLDNPRQLSFTPSGHLLIAQAGHGGQACSHGQCVGKTGKVSVIRNGSAHNEMTGLLSGAGRDGTFATGVDGAGKRVGGPYFGIVTYAPPD